MVARHLRLPSRAPIDLPLAGAVSAATALMALLVSHRVGGLGILAPLVVVVVAIAVLRPLFTVTAVVALTVLCEGPSFGILTFSSHLYTQVYKDVSVLDLLVVLTVLAVAVDLIRSGRSLHVPGPLKLPLALLVLAMVAGAITGHAAGASTRFALASEDVLAYLVVLPVVVANLEIDGERLRWLLGGAVGLAIVKAVLGLMEVASGHGQTIEGSTTLTYYEPTANWIVMMALLAIFAAVLARARPPLWMLLGSPLLLASLLLSYRRSFWIAGALGVLLILLLGTSPMGRRLLLPVGLLVALAIWLLGSTSFQSQSPIIKRVTSLQTSKVEANVEDRYRLDERANVLSEIDRHPIAGLGMTIPWEATARPLPVEHEGGRLYVHFAALWFWLKLGILGLFAYLAIIASSLVLAFRAWRATHEPMVRAFGLASLCGVVALVVLDTTASFTGVDARFTVLFGAQLGLLALIADRRLGPSSSLDSASIE
jgi:hypothetical protein